jgi:hypothetical protein
MPPNLKKNNLFTMRFATKMQELKAVLRIRDVHLGPEFSIPDPGSNG